MVYRQGDVSLHKINKIPSRATKAVNNTLALGEITGHRHFLKNDQICVFQLGMNKYVELLEDTELVHSGPDLQPVYDQEIATEQDKHVTFTVQKGLYKVEIEQEFDPFTEAVQQAMD